MMTIDDFYVDKAKESLIEAYKERIYQAFHVNITFCHDGDKLSTKICMSSSDENGTSKNVKKAKTYLESLTADGETLSRCIQTLPTSYFTMVQELQSTIERDSQAVVDLSKENSHVCIFGKKENVSIAQALIDQLVKKQGSIEPYIDIHSHARDKGQDGRKFQKGSELISTNDDKSNVDSMNENGNVLCEEDRETSDVSHLKLQSSESISRVSTVTGPTEKRQLRTHLALKRTVSVGMSPLPSELTAPSKCLLTKTMSYGHNVKLTENSLSNLKLKHQSSTSSEEDTTDEEEYNTKIEFALKLGYSELQLASVLKKLGNKAGQNEILSELIKLSTSTDKEPRSCEEENPNLCALEGSSENLLAFTSENCFDLSDSNFRPIVIDGSNVAMSHGNKEIFSCRGIQLAVDWFKDRGHKAITVFVPQWRKETSRVDAKITDQDILFQLEKEKILVFTPARRIGGKRVVCYDDRYILNLAVDSGGVVVSNDNYRDLVTEKSEYRKVVEERLLMYSFVNDRFMPPDDPLGRHGPSLDNFLSKEPRQPEPLPPVCPYGSKKCTYGNKCKFYHPERGNMPHKMVTEKLAEQAKQKIQEVRENRKTQEGSKAKQPLCKKSSRGKAALTRTQSLTPKPLPDSLVADTPTKRLSGDFGEAAMEVLPRNVEYRDVESEEKWRSYNDKLSEHRKQVEQADKEQQRQRSETMESQFNVKMQSVEPFNMASKMEQCGSRSSSPRQRSTPSPQLMPPQPQEMFLSGHLMLAKKLSDEAGETKTHKSEERLFNTSPPSNYACPSPLSTPVKQNKPLTQHPSLMLNQQLPPHHQPLSQQFSHPVPMQHQHQRLSRQYSLQGSQDPRLRQECMSSAHPSRRPLPQDNFGVFGIPHNTFAGENFANLPPQFSGRPDHRYIGEESEHAALARMQSAPETMFTRHDNNSHKRFGRMVRQNSSSDTQIHMIGDTDLGPSEYSLFPSECVDFNRGNPQNSQYSSGMTPQRMDPRHLRSRAVGSYPKPQEYRSQHGNGETRWTFEPVLGLGLPGYGSHYPANQGIDAFESDYPSVPTWQSQENVKYSVEERYRYQQPSYDPFHESSGLPFSQHRPAERCHSGGFSFQNQTPSNMCAMSNFCENQHSMLQNPSGKQSVGIIGEEHKQSLSRTSSANLSGHPSCPQSFGATMNPIGTSMMEGAGNRPKFSEFAPIEPTDKRYNLYYHLCGLFPEPKVRKVMTDHPEETSPQELCALIINMK
ncbi:uncharacterized protein LOC133178593 [Saccostrea echinata]|uniref:uncharacterized protein LOC133178593 n=1 Tax=Saccostrea echinata TaxID=191078 RepID=UPI002A826938|nr:uncharacterized protein LOC133178593 [Saccostrea echinata]